MRKVFINIKQLLQIREKGEFKVAGTLMDELPKIDNAYLAIKDDKITAFGKMEDYSPEQGCECIDATGRLLLPSWCDSHSHTVFAGHRIQEFVDRINGLSYEEVAQRGGGILNSAKTLEKTSEASLFKQSMARIKELEKLGTGALEIKSGYGLTVDAELKMLRVIKKIAQQTAIKIKATFLGAHAVPEAYKSKKSAYVDLIINKMLPRIKTKNLADYVDVFCEKGYFDLKDTDRILTAAKRYGLLPKIHVNQFNAFGGVAMGVKHKALSVDHLEKLSKADVDILKHSQTMPVALPGCSFFLGIPYTPSRELIDAGLPLALATDFNPGSAPSGNMNLIVSLACIKMKMTPEEALNAATLNGAYAMGISDDYGSITVGKKANLILTKPMENYAEIPYAFGNNPVYKTVLNGRVLN